MYVKTPIDMNGCVVKNNMLELSGDKLWGIERRSDTPERIVFIYEALQRLVDEGKLPNDFSIIDIAGGRGVVLNGLAGLFTCVPTILDFNSYPDWRYLKTSIKMLVKPLQEYIKEGHPHDVIMMLNSYRNWPKTNKSGGIKARQDFDRWVVKNAKYFVTSNCDLPYKKLEIRGHDFKGVLQLFDLSCPE